MEGDVSEDDNGEDNSIGGDVSEYDQNIGGNVSENDNGEDNNFGGDVSKNDNGEDNNSIGGDVSEDDNGEDNNIESDVSEEDSSDDDTNESDNSEVGDSGDNTCDKDAFEHDEPMMARRTEAACQLFGRYPQLTELKLYNWKDASHLLTAVGQHCPQLQHLTVRHSRIRFVRDLRAVATGCPHLRTLDLEAQQHLLPFFTLNR